MKNILLIAAINCLLILSDNTTSFAQNVNAAKVDSSKLKYGKYGCTSSKYSGGSVQYTPRFFIFLLPDAVMP